jgi:Putative peptidoglycan binding domain
MAALMKGDKHPAVGKLQEALNRLGATPQLVVDDDYGNFTKIAVRRFQESQPKLTCVFGGIAGTETLDRLGIRIEVEKLVLRLPLIHNASENWAAPLGVNRVGYSELGPRNSDAGQILDFVQYSGTAFVLTGYETLMGGRVALSLGVYVFHGRNDPDRVEVKSNECASLVQAFGLPQTRHWRRGPRVRDMAAVLPGTVVATMRDDRYYSDYSGRSHVAIFLRKDDHGMLTVDQWNGSDIHQEHRRFKPEDLGEQRPFPLNKGERPYGWISDADEYYVVYSTEKSVHRDYN